MWPPAGEGCGGRGLGAGAAGPREWLEARAVAQRLGRPGPGALGRAIDLAKVMEEGQPGRAAQAAAAGRLLSQEQGRGKKGTGGGDGDGVWDARGRPEVAVLLAAALGDGGAGFSKGWGLQAGEALTRLLGGVGLREGAAGIPAAGDPAACKAVLCAAERCLEDTVFCTAGDARPLQAAPPYAPDLLLFVAQLREWRQEARQVGYPDRDGLDENGLEALQERLLGVLGSLVCAALFPPEGLEPLLAFCNAALAPPAAQRPDAERGAAAGSGSEVGLKVSDTSEAELLSGGEQDFRALIGLLGKDGSGRAAAAQCLPWVLQQFERALELRSSLGPAPETEKGGHKVQPGGDFRLVAGLFFSVVSEACSWLPAGDAEKTDADASPCDRLPALEALRALLDWMLNCRERLSPMFGLLRHPFQRLGAALVGFLCSQTVDLGRTGVARGFNPREVELCLSCLADTLDLDSRVVACLDHSVWLGVWSLPMWRLRHEQRVGEIMYEDALVSRAGGLGAADQLIEAYCSSGRSQKMIDDWTEGQEALWAGRPSPAVDPEVDPRTMALGLFRPGLLAAVGRALAVATPWSSVEVVGVVSKRLKNDLEDPLPSQADNSRAGGALAATLYTGGGVLLAVPHKPECAQHLLKHCTAVLRAVAAALIRPGRDEALLVPTLYVGHAAATLLHRSGGQMGATPSVPAVSSSTLALTGLLAECFRSSYALHRAKVAGVDPCFKPAVLAEASAGLAVAWDSDSESEFARSWRSLSPTIQAMGVESVSRTLSDDESVARALADASQAFERRVFDVVCSSGGAMSAWNGVTVSVLSGPSFLLAMLLQCPGEAPPGASAIDDDAVARVLERAKTLRSGASSALRLALSQALRGGIQGAESVASRYYKEVVARLHRVDNLALRSGCVKMKRQARPLLRLAKLARTSKDRQDDGRRAAGADSEGAGSVPGGVESVEENLRALLRADASRWTKAAKSRHACQVTALVYRLLLHEAGSGSGQRGLGLVLEEVLRRTDLKLDTHAQALVCHAATVLLATEREGAPSDELTQLLQGARAAAGRLVTASKRFKFLESRLPPVDADATVTCTAGAGAAATRASHERPAGGINA